MVATKFRLKRKTRNQVAIAIAVVAIGAVSLPGVLENSERWARKTQRLKQEADTTEQLELEQELRQARAAIADKRFESCLFVQQPGEKTIVAVTEGVQVIDTKTGRPLPAGKLVCDITGTTAVLGADGFPQEFAYTGNTSAIQAAMRRSGINLNADDRNFGSSTRAVK